MSNLIDPQRTFIAPREHLPNDNIEYNDSIDNASFNEVFDTVRQSHSYDQNL